MTRQVWRTLFALILLLGAGSAFAFEPFVVEEIEVEGLQRISPGTVFNYLPIKRGETLDKEASARSVRALYRTGFFENVVLERRGNTLIVFVEERPAIASIDIEGNKDIPSDQLTENLGQVGFAEGRIFDPSMLAKVEQELERQYLARGKYGVRIESKVTPLERNRVGVEIKIAEGEEARIRRIRIIGNHAFDNAELLDQFELGPTPLFSLFSSRDQYSRERLAADMETLRSFYLDRGFINFNIVSTQVSITPDRSQVYITINVDEGERYSVSDVAVAGETIMPEDELRKLISINAGDTFSRRRITESTTRISERLGDVGYAFANVNAIPELDEEKQQVALTFFVDPAQRVYVRRINISGNKTTHDEVLRREMRQMEAAWISTDRLKRSRTRLERLGFFEQVNVETPAVPGTTDEVDVEVSVKERETFGSLSFGIGYGEVQGFLVNANITQQNFLGTGKRFSLAVDNSQVNTIYSFSLTEPYYTPEGISRTTRLSYRSTDYDEANVVNYSTDTAGAGLTYGIPLTEYNQARLGVEYDYTRLNTFDSTSQEIVDFCVDNASVDDCSFDAVKATASWSNDTRNRTIFPTEGRLRRVAADLALPVGGQAAEFYKLRLSEERYFPLTDRLTFGANAEFSFGDSYGRMTELPPFERYYAGGTRTVRGFRANRLGPKDADGDPLGGNARVLGGAQLIFPAPFAENSSSVRLSTFIDAGNVFDTRDSHIDLGEIRYSAGIGLTWLSPMGALKFSVANPLNDKPGDETESFQFTLGSPF